MLNIRDLEKRWLRYKIKSYIPHAVIAVSSIIIVIFAVVVFTNKDEHMTTSQSKNTTITTKEIKQVTIPKETNTSKKTIQYVQKEETPVTKKKEVPKSQLVIEKEEDLTLKPSMNFMKHIESEDQQPYYKTINTTPPKKLKRKKIIKQEPIEEEYMDVQQTQAKPIQKTQQKTAPKVKIEKPYKKQIITIKRRDSENDIKEIISRFKKNNNPALSLFVAKKYYELGNYEQAYNYALITNGINNDIEDSWLVFAKSLVKLNRKDMAIKTLSEYIKYSHSGNAKILLNDIKSGKFQ